VNPIAADLQTPYLLAPALASVADLTKRFGRATALDALTLDVRQGEVLVVIGPSGCGKTTLLRCIAGLERPDGGEVRIGGDVASGPGAFVPPERRGIGMVFQSLALWPHLRVADQIRFVLAGRGLSRDEVERRAQEGLASVGLAERARAHPHELSGGERQRVALVRALATEPRLLLLDEPLSDLDPALREELRDETAARIRRLGVAAIWVTHDHDEGLAIADRVAVLRAGRLEQIGPAEEVHRRPRTRFVAEFLGRGTVVRGEVGGDGVARTAFGDVPCDDAAPGGAWVALPPEALRARRRGPGARGVVTSRSVRSGRRVVRVDLGALSAVAESDEPLGLGDAVHVVAIGEGRVVRE
jgi:iron(III) transport system ATP-binding protein